jgi:hypothetical protein
MRKILIILIAAAIQATAQSPARTPVSIQVDLAATKGAYKPIYSWFGYDESNYITMKYGRELLTQLHDLSPVPVYIREHHLLTSGNGVALATFCSRSLRLVSSFPAWKFLVGSLAENLTAALKRDWGCDAACLYYY